MGNSFYEIEKLVAGLKRTRHVKGGRRVAVVNARTTTYAHYRLNQPPALTKWCAKAIDFAESIS